MPHFLWFSLGEWSFVMFIATIALCVLYGIAVALRSIALMGIFAILAWATSWISTITFVVWLILWIIDYAKR